MKKDSSLLIIGGGAAGFFAALRAKASAPSLPVTLLEAAPKPLGKVKISGGGRCNVTHNCFDAARLVQYYPRGSRELKSVFSRFGPADTVAWFESRGVKLKTETDGRIFPITDDSQTIIDCLLQEARTLGVQVHLRAAVESVQKAASGFQVTCKDGRMFSADKVLLAPGSARIALSWVQALGHTLIPPVPSLFTFVVKSPLLQDLAGVSLPHVVGKLIVSGEKKPLTQEGPLLITHWGLSGPVVLRLSAWGARALAASRYQATLAVDFLPTIPFDSLRQALLSQKADTPKRHLGNQLPSLLQQTTFPKRFWERLLSTQGLHPDTPWGEAPDKALNRLAETLKRCEFPVTGKGEFKDEFVTAGGVALSDVDLSTMESRRCPGLYLAGEILDIDGLTGGFNFQSAWSTGWLAGEAMIFL